MFAQISDLNLDLQNRWLQEVRGPVTNSFQDKSYEQYYNFGLNGYIYSKKLLVFSYKASYSDIDTDYKIVNTTNNRKQRDIGFYNATATLFPENGFKLRVFARHNRTDFINDGLIVPETGREFSSVQNNKDYGFNMHFPRNTFYPQVDIGMRRLLQKCEEPCTEVYRKEDIVSVAMRNSSGAGANYSADYRGRFQNDLSDGWASKEHQIRFQGRSRISDLMEVNTSGLIYLRDAHISRDINLQAYYSPNTDMRHRFSVRNSELRLFSGDYSRNATTNATHRMYWQTSDALQTVLGATYETQSQVNQGDRLSGDKFQIHGKVDYRKVHSGMSVTGAASFDGGLEQHIGFSRRFLQRSLVGGGLGFPIGKVARIHVYNDVYFENLVAGGTHLRNSFRLDASSDLISQVTLRVLARRTDAFFSASAILPDNANTTLEGFLTWRPWYPVSITVQHAERITSSVYSDRSSRTLAGVTMVDLIKNLDLHVQVEQSSSSLTRFITQRIESEIRYKFYAFSLSMKYYREVYGTYLRDRVLFEVRRPLNFRFR